MSFPQGKYIFLKDYSFSFIKARERGGTTCRKGPRVESNPWPLRQGLSLYTWGARAATELHQHPRNQGEKTDGLPEVLPVLICKIRSNNKPPGTPIMDHIHDTNTETLKKTKQMSQNPVFK